MKKLLTLCLSLLLIATMAISGTIAFLTDSEEKINVFTVGNVDITLEEEFDQIEGGVPLTPGVTVKKKPYIKNVGANSAWVWLTYAIPAEIVESDKEKDFIHINVPEGHEDEWMDPVFDKEQTPYEDSEGNKYYIATMLRKESLAPEAQTGFAFESVYLDNHIDRNPDYDSSVDGSAKYCYVENGVVTPVNGLNDTVNIVVKAYAIQTDEFTTVEEAYAAYGEQWSAASSDENDDPSLPGSGDVNPDPSAEPGNP